MKNSFFLLSLLLIFGCKHDSPKNEISDRPNASGIYQCTVTGYVVNQSDSVVLDTTMAVTITGPTSKPAYYTYWMHNFMGKDSTEIIQVQSGNILFGIVYHGTELCYTYEMQPSTSGYTMEKFYDCQEVGMPGYGIRSLIKATLTKQ